MKSAPTRPVPPGSRRRARVRRESTVRTCSSRSASTARAPRPRRRSGSAESDRRRTRFFHVDFTKRVCAKRRRQGPAPAHRCRDRRSSDATQAVKADTREHRANREIDQIGDQHQRRARPAQIRRRCPFHRSSWEWGQGVERRIRRLPPARVALRLAAWPERARDASRSARAARRASDVPKFARSRRACLHP